VTRLALALVVAVGLGACAPAPGASVPTPTVTPSAAATQSNVPTATAAPTPAPEKPTPPPAATLPTVLVSSDRFAVAPTPSLIELAGPPRADAENLARSWAPLYVKALDDYRTNPTEQARNAFDGLNTPGPYTEVIRASLQTYPAPAGRRSFAYTDLTLLHIWAKPWGRAAYMDVTLRYVDKVFDNTGALTTTIDHVQQMRLVNTGQGFLRVIDGYDPVLARWINGDQPRWSALALESEASNAVASVLVRESYVPNEQYPHGATGGLQVTPSAYDTAVNARLVDLDRQYTAKEFATRRFDAVSVAITRFEPASFLGDGVVTATLTAKLVTATAGGPERSTPVTRTLRFYRIARDGFGGFWMPVDEQLPSGSWISGGQLDLAQIDIDRG
jgi:hypothetical protein